MISELEFPDAMLPSSVTMICLTGILSCLDSLSHAGGKVTKAKKRSSNSRGGQCRSYEVDVMKSKYGQNEIYELKSISREVAKGRMDEA